MKRKGLLLILLTFVCLFFATAALPNVSAAEEKTASITFSESGMADKEDLTTKNVEDVTLVGNKGSNTNAPKYYANGTAVRIYGGNTLTVSVSEGYQITKITITFGSSDGSNAITADSGSFNTNIWTGNSRSVVLTIGGTSGNRRFSAIAVTYVSTGNEGGEEPGEQEKPTYAAAADVQALIEPYYGNEENEGIYTKKSYININQNAIEDIATFDVSSLFVGDVRLDRTTYYWPNELLMTTIDNKYAEYNSGYGTATNGNLTQFKVDANGEKISEWGSAGKTHPNWNDTSKDGMEGFYVTLNDLMEDDYFAATENNGWILDDNVATYNVTNNNEEVVKDFLAFVAPCFEPVILNDTYKFFFGLAKLEIATGTNNRVGDYLRLRIYITEDCSSYVYGAENVLAEACIYKGTVEFDENNLTAANLVEMGAKKDSFVQMPVTFVKHTMSGSTNYYHFNDLNGVEIKVTGSELTNAVKAGTLTLNDTLVLNFKATSISAEYINGNTATIVGEVTAVEDPETINSTIVDVLDGKIVSQGQMVVIEGVVVSIDIVWSEEYENMTVTISDVNGNEIKVYRTETLVEVGQVVAVTGKVGYYSPSIQIAEGSTCEEIEPTTSEELAYQAIIDEKEISKLEVQTNGTEGFQVPTTGAFGSEVVWTVSPEAAVSIDANGNVTFERGGENVTVTLTATIGESSKEFEFTIKAKEQEGGGTQPTVETVTYDFVSKFNSFGWDSNYKSRTIASSLLGDNLPKASITFSTANKQSQTITDRPVLRTNSNTEYVTIKIEEGSISSVTFNILKWTTKTLQDIHIEYYNGSSWVQCSDSIKDPVVGTISSNVSLPDGVTQVRLAVKGSGKVQLGITNAVLDILK